VLGICRGNDYDYDDDDVDNNNDNDNKDGRIYTVNVIYRFNRIFLTIHN
jgi:hypothetical protein